MQDMYVMLRRLRTLGAPLLAIVMACLHCGLILSERTSGRDSISSCSCTLAERKRGQSIEVVRVLERVPDLLAVELFAALLN